MPLYDRIIEFIMNDINNNVLKEGDRLPTEMELSRKFGVSRPTVRTALTKLVNEGYLNRVKGSGTYVTKPKLLQESTQFIESYNQEMKGKGLVPKTLVLEFRVVSVDESVASRLNLKPGDKVIKVKRLRYAAPYYEERPVVLTTVYIPYEAAPQIMSYDLEKQSLYDALKENNIYINKVERVLEVKLIFGKTAKLLEVKENSPAHFISSVGYANNIPLEYSESFYPADRNKFIIRIIR